MSITQDQAIELVKALQAAAFCEPGYSIMRNGTDCDEPEDPRSVRVMGAEFEGGVVFEGAPGRASSTEPAEVSRERAIRFATAFCNILNADLP